MMKPFAICLALVGAIGAVGGNAVAGPGLDRGMRPDSYRGVSAALEAAQRRCALEQYPADVSAMPGLYSVTVPKGSRKATSRLTLDPSHGELSPADQRYFKCTKKRFEATRAVVMGDSRSAQFGTVLGNISNAPKGVLDKTAAQRYVNDRYRAITKRCKAKEFTATITVATDGSVAAVSVEPTDVCIERGIRSNLRFPALAAETTLVTSVSR